MTSGLSGKAADPWAAPAVTLPMGWRAAARCPLRQVSTRPTPPLPQDLPRPGPWLLLPLPPPPAREGVTVGLSPVGGSAGHHLARCMAWTPPHWCGNSLFPQVNVCHTVIMVSFHQTEGPKLEKQNTSRHARPRVDTGLSPGGRMQSRKPRRRVSRELTG